MLLKTPRTHLDAISPTLGERKASQENPTEWNGHRDAPVDGRGRWYAIVGAGKTPLSARTTATDSDGKTFLPRVSRAFNTLSNRTKLSKRAPRAPSKQNEAKAPSRHMTRGAPGDWPTSRVGPGESGVGANCAASAAAARGTGRTAGKIKEKK